MSEQMERDLRVLLDLIVDSNHHLQDENAKLRDRISTIYMCSNIMCDQCKYSHGVTCAFDAETELRKLGIEVPEEE